jgi:hypothetical protein
MAAGVMFLIGAAISGSSIALRNGGIFLGIALAVFILAAVIYHRLGEGRRCKASKKQPPQQQSQPPRSVVHLHDTTRVPSRANQLELHMTCVDTVEELRAFGDDWIDPEPKLIDKMVSD